MSYEMLFLTTSFNVREAGNFCLAVFIKDRSMDFSFNIGVCFTDSVLLTRGCRTYHGLWNLACQVSQSEEWLTVVIYNAIG